MSDLFKLIFSMSLSGSVIILILLLSGPLFKERFSKAWQYYIWLIVLLRLAVPYSPEFGLTNGLFREAQARGAAAVEADAPAGPEDNQMVEGKKTIEDRQIIAGDARTGDLPAAPTLAVPRTGPGSPPDLWQMAGWIWLSCAFLLYVFKMVQYARFSSKIRSGVRRVSEARVLSLLAKTAEEMHIGNKPPVFESPEIQSPMLMGLVKPAVFLPETALQMDDGSLAYVFRHELTHFKRRDLLYKWIAELILCVHWFNPLAYVMSSRLNRNCELSCDEAVAKELDTEAKRQYGGTLLMAVSENARYKRNVLTTTLCEDKKNLKERLSAILKAGRKSRRAIVLSVVAAAVLCGTAVWLGAFSSGHAVPAAPDGTPSGLKSSEGASSEQPGQPDAESNKPYLPWEAIKRLADGSLGYSDFRESYYYKVIGSGLYIISYPIEDAPGFSLVVSYMDPDADPVAVRLCCADADLSLPLNVENLAESLGVMMDLYNGGSSQKEVQRLFYSQIPVPDGAKTYKNILYLSGRAPDEIMRDYQELLKNSGFELTDALGMKRYYKKAVNGSDLAISVLCLREGGPQDADIPTVIRFAVELSPYEEEDKREQDEQEVRKLADAFGKTLQKVSLSAPDSVVSESIKNHYGDYVTPELLQKWQAHPQSAPGRMVSSPWPERIDILSAEQGSDTEWTVYGEIIEVTSVELAQGGAAAKRPVTIEFQKADGRFLISGITLGEYAQRGPIVYENTRYGFRFYLPETWKGYTVVEEKWQGEVLGETGTQPGPTGPELLIRHPDWTEKDPRQDIPIMVFTNEQWNAVQKGELVVSAAPIGPRKLGGNSEYVFALPARYNFAFPTGYEEVEKILDGDPLWAN